MNSLQIKYKGKVAGQVTVSGNIIEKTQTFVEEAPSIIKNARKKTIQ
jgi:hypothetical protein